MGSLSGASAAVFGLFPENSDWRSDFRKPHFRVFGIRSVVRGYICGPAVYGLVGMLSTHITSTLGGISVEILQGRRESVHAIQSQETTVNGSTVVATGG